MRLCIISFTQRGKDLSEKLAGRLEEIDVRLYTKWGRAKAEGSVLPLKEDLKLWTGRQMREGNGLVFIGACAIAVRTIAPFLTDKLHDSPVLVIDENGRYVIPILSGHVGGANELATLMAEKLNAAPVITTATDLRNVFAADVFARRNQLFIVNREGIAKVSSKALSGETITISVESGHIEGQAFSSLKDSNPLDVTANPGQPAALSGGVVLVEYPPVVPVDVMVTSGVNMWDASLILRPREYVIGMGCRRGKEAGKIECFIRQALEEAKILIEQVGVLASIDLKSREEGLLSWTGKQRIPFITYTSGELNETEGEVRPSSFVKQMTGTDNVCERAALKAAGPGGELIYEKHAKDGMTIAIAKRIWSVSFDEE